MSTIELRCSLKWIRSVWASALASTTIILELRSFFHAEALGKYLLAKGNENDKIRGLFWIKKAAKNGYEVAEKIVEELKENEE